MHSLEIQTPTLETPTVPGPPIVGHAIPFSTDIRKFLSAQFVKHGPVFQVPVMGRKFLALAGPAANALAQTENGQLLGSADIWDPFEEVFDMDSPHMLRRDGPQHALLRSGLSSGYADSSLYAQMPKLMDSLLEIIGAWPQGTPFSVFPQVKRWVSMLLGYLATNEKPDAVMDGMIYFFKAMILIHFQKKWSKFIQGLPKYTRSWQALLDMARRIWEERAVQEIVAGEENFVDAVREFQKTHPDLMTEKDEIAAILGPFLSGLDPAGSVISFKLFHILRNPELKAAVQEEADRVCGQGLPNRQSMPQTLHAAMETLRICTPSPVMVRLATQDFEFEGYRISKGQTLMIAQAVRHFMPEFFPEPDKFDVGRFAPPRSEHTQQHAYAPYGLGPHTCLGTSSADLLYLIVSAALFHHCELELDPPDLQIKTTMNPLFSPSDDLKVILHPRRV